MHQERQLFELDSQVNRNEAHAGRHAQYYGGEVQQAADAGGYKRVRHSLSGFGRDRHQSELGMGGGKHRGHRFGRLDLQTVDALADLGRIRVKQGHEAKALLLEAAIAQQGAGQVADPDHGHQPLPVDAQPVTQSGRQVQGGITNPGLTKITQVGQVLANLVAANPQRLAEPAAGNRLNSLAVKQLKMAQIQAETPDTGTRQTRLAAGYLHRRLLLRGAISFLPFLIRPIPGFGGVVGGGALRGVLIPPPGARRPTRRTLRLTTDHGHYILVGNPFRLVEQKKPSMNSIADALRLAVQYHQSGAFQEAESVYWQILQADPNQADAWHLLGVLTSQGGRHELAVTYIQKALDINPGTGPFLYNLGLAYKGLDRKAEAIACFQQALEWRADYAPAHNALGGLLLAEGSPEQARAHCQEAIRLNPNLVEAHLNLGNVHVEEDEPAEALACFDRAIRIKPDYADAYVNKGSVLGKQGDLDQALACLETALRIKPDHAEAHGNRALIFLVHGDFARGWPEYEWRWQCQGKMPAFHQPVWDGSPLAGRTILLHAEQGLGDTLHFIRYAALVKQLGGRVLVQCQTPLVPILKSFSGIDELVPRTSPLPTFDVHAPLLSLPRTLNTTMDTIPAQVPYLFADASLVAHWQKELSVLKGLKVGINWQGRPDNPSERYRRIPLSQFAPLAKLPGVHLISLHKGPGWEETQALADRFTVVDLGRGVDEASGPFMDTAAIMRNLDLVITSDTVVPHLAGALGVPVWLALPVSPDWRWLLHRQDSPWYPTMRLFRQDKPGDWDSVFERITAALEGLTGGPMTG